MDVNPYKSPESAPERPWRIKPMDCLTTIATATMLASLALMRWADMKSPLYNRAYAVFCAALAFMAASGFLYWWPKRIQRWRQDGSGRNSN